MNDVYGKFKFEPRIILCNDYKFVKIKSTGFREFNKIPFFGPIVSNLDEIENFEEYQEVYSYKILFIKFNKHGWRKIFESHKSIIEPSNNFVCAKQEFEKEYRIPNKKELKKLKFLNKREIKRELIEVKLIKLSGIK